MWSSSYSQKVTGVNRQRVWEVWTDVDRWSTWQDDVEYAHLEGKFATGTVIRFKPKGGPRVRIELTDVQAPSRFVDVTRFRWPGWSTLTNSSRPTRDWRSGAPSTWKGRSPSCGASWWAKESRRAFPSRPPGSSNEPAAPERVRRQMKRGRRHDSHRPRRP